MQPRVIFVWTTTLGAIGGGLWWLLHERWPVSGDPTAPDAPSPTAAGSVVATARFGDSSDLPLSRAQHLADALALPVDVVQTIAHVESRGSDTAIRFEPHVFLRKHPNYLLGKENEDGTVGVIPYTRTSKKQSWDSIASHTNLDAFMLAFALDRNAAVEATSFGRFQVLGSWLTQIGGGNSLVGFDAWRANPAVVSDELLIRWFNSNKAAKHAARNRDWATFAKIYNGPGRVEEYSALLSDANQRYGGPLA